MKLVILFEPATLLPSTNLITLRIFNYIGEFDRDGIRGGEMGLREDNVVEVLVGEIKVIKFDINNQCGWRMGRKKIFVLENIKSVLLNIAECILCCVLLSC
jgi:hypothetical protein